MDTVHRRHNRCHGESTEHEKGIYQDRSRCGNAFVSRIDRLREDCNEGRLIFDRYLRGSLKEVTRKKRSENTNSVR